MGHGINCERSDEIEAKDIHDQRSSEDQAVPCSSIKVHLNCLKISNSNHTSFHPPPQLTSGVIQRGHSCLRLARGGGITQWTSPARCRQLWRLHQCVWEEWLCWRGSSDLPRAKHAFFCLIDVFQFPLYDNINIIYIWIYIYDLIYIYIYLI